MYALTHEQLKTIIEVVGDLLDSNQEDLGVKLHSSISHLTTQHRRVSNKVNGKGY